MCNAQTQPVDVIVITRGGGSPEDLAAFSTESVVRAVATSRIPVLAAIGHEIDTSLVELAADIRASTPSNAAELLVPERATVLKQLEHVRQQFQKTISGLLLQVREQLEQNRTSLSQHYQTNLLQARLLIGAREQTLQALNPDATLRRGYSVLRQRGSVVRVATELHAGPTKITFADGDVSVSIDEINVQ
jgi:exodeoxyribonuclease VII large subunit